MYLFSPDYRFTRTRMDERLKRAESGRRANEVHRTEPSPAPRTAAVARPAPRQVEVAGTPHLRLVK
jgi:hypothetical protein